MIFRTFLFFIVALAGSSPAAASEKLQVVASIGPIQLIVNEIMAGNGQALVLMQDNESPHHFQLRPSQLKTVGASDLLVWISNDFESALAKLQRNLPDSSVGLQLIDSIPAENLIGDHGNIDGHIWLAPENIILMAKTITQKLSALDPENRRLYEGNLKTLSDNLQQWQLGARMKTQTRKPRYILDHQFLAYLEHGLGLPEARSLRSNHDHGSSIRKLSDLNAYLRDEPVSCLLVTQLPPARQARQLAEKHNLKIKPVYTLNEGNRYNSIVELLEAIVLTVQDCH